MLGYAHVVMPAIVNDMLKSMMFIHIPKIAGSTMEAILGKNQLIISRPHPPPPKNFLDSRSGWVSPWHMPPDMYEHLLGRKYNSNRLKKRFCIVRNPIDRYISDMYWSKNRFKTPIAKLAEKYAQNWSAVRWNEELVHRMPQHMFIFSRSGHVQCDCVIAIERLKNVTDIVKNDDKNKMSHHDFVLPHGFFALYSADRMIWSSALQYHDLCYKVEALV